METGLSQEPLLPLPSTHLCQAKGRKDSCGTSEHKFQPLFNHPHDSKAPKPQGNSSPPYHFPSLVTHIPLIFQSYPSRKPPIRDSGGTRVADGWDKRGLRVGRGQGFA